VVKALASHIVVLRDGRIVEQGDATEIFANPREKYTRELFAAAFDLNADVYTAAKV
jgi:microcin C transport system ATP-binding protein